MDFRNAIVKLDEFLLLTFGDTSAIALSLSHLAHHRPTTEPVVYALPEGLTSCHTAEIGDYIVEGHVPSAEIIRLLKERPVAKGLVVAGMPKNSPGMEMTGAPAEKYGVMLFFADKEPIEYAVYSGAVRIS